MIRSKYFWTGAILLAAIPFLVMDIPKHYVDWEKEVREEMINVTQNVYSYNVQQKATILDHILESNKYLMAMMYLKSFIVFILLCISVYCFRVYKRRKTSSNWKAVFPCVILVSCSVALKLYLWTGFTGDQRIKILTRSPADTTLTSIYNNHFKGKVVYADFWGTTCGSCLEEFMNFTKPLKLKYHNRKDIAYLYICCGHQLVWKQQLKKFDVEGWHVFLDSTNYNQLFRRSIKGNKNTIVAMPRYLIMDKHGKIVETDAPPPSEPDSAYAKLNKYLANN